MQQRILLTFSGERYHNSTKKIVEDGPRLGANRVLVYDDFWLKEKRPEFCKEHAALFTKKCAKSGNVRGVCWFLWKPMIIADALSRCQDGDIVGFTDGDCWPVADMTPLYDLADRDGMVLFAACSHSQRHWSKRDTQIVMGMDHEWWRRKQAGVARFMLFKKGASIKWIQYPLAIGIPLDATPEQIESIPREVLPVEEFLNKWFKYTADIRANTFDRSILADEYADLKEPRCEQAILTNLAHKYDIPLHRECDQWGNNFKADFPNDTYGQIFESTGVYSHDPKPLPGQKGSRFRNVND